MAYQQMDDDELRSAFFDDAPKPPAATAWAGTAPTAMTGTPGTPGTPTSSAPSTTGPTGQNFAAAPQPAGQAGGQMSALAQGGGAYEAIMGTGGQQPGSMADLAKPTGSGSGNLADYADPSKMGGTTSGNLSDLARTGTATPGGQAKPGDPIAVYKDQVARINQATDPAAAAAERDKLARNLATSLQESGSKVQWDGDTLVVDGRRYVMPAGGAMDSLSLPSGGGGGYDGSGINPNPGGIVNAQTGQPVGGAPAGQGGVGVTEGFDSTKFGKNDPKYVFQRIASTISNTDPDRSAKLLAALKADPSGFFANATLEGDKLHANSSDPIYNGITDFDIQRDEENGGAFHWEPIGGAGGGRGGAAPTVHGIDAPGAGGVTLGTGGGTPASYGAGGGGGALPGFLTDDAPYTPGEIGMDDIPDLQTDAILGQMGNYTPTRYEVGNLDDGPVAGDEERLMRSILGSPESLDPATVARMKVSGRENAAELGRQDDDELTALSYEGGFAGSPFVASQRLARRAQTNRDIQNNERNVDIAAAQTNAADRRSAAQLGSGYLAERSAASRGNEQLRQSAAGMNESNVFNAASLRSSNVANAAKLSLDAAAQRGDRMALRESAAQQAAALGISRDKLLADYTTAQMDDMTRRFGINVDAELRREGFDIDRMKTQLSASEFQQELAFKLQQLAQQYETDMTGIGLGYAKLDTDRYLGEMNAVNNAIFG